MMIKTFCKFLKYGFPIGYAKQDLPISDSRNRKGAELYPESVDNFIETELSYNALLGPFSGNPLCSSAVSIWPNYMFSITSL